MSQLPYSVVITAIESSATTRKNAQVTRHSLAFIHLNLPLSHNGYEITAGKEEMHSSEREGKEKCAGAFREAPVRVRTGVSKTPPRPHGRSGQRAVWPKHVDIPQE